MADLVFTRDDIDDIRLLHRLARTAGERAAPGFAAVLAADPAAAARAETLIARGLVALDPGSAFGVRLTVPGEARLHRFLRAPVGAAAPAAEIHEECALRRDILDLIEPEDRAELERRLVGELLAMRRRLFCAFALACRDTGCPLNGAHAIEICDLALFRLAQDRPWPLDGRAQA